MFLRINKYVKNILIILSILTFSSSAFCAEWVEIFEKQYVDMSSIEVSLRTNSIEFWVKSLRKDPKEVFPLTNKPYWYTMNKWHMACTSKQERIEAMAVYDLKGNVMYSDNYKPEWNEIIPDTYADGYYRLFCSVPFDKNPIFNLRY